MVEHEENRVGRGLAAAVEGTDAVLVEEDVDEEGGDA
jgi:hypothetical protein